MENDTSTSALKGHRTLATVVFTDCVGFSARMSVDEDHTLKLIHRDLKLMKRMCEQFEGRVLKSTGDGLLMHFISAVKAVEFAIAIQTALTEAAAQLSSNDALQHRIGIHLADIFITETDVMGNGVNIAARLQAAADPGGICISQTVYDVVKAGLHIETQYLGPRELKNIREVIPVYKVLLKPGEDALEQYATVARNLEQNPQLPRIKKLLFYVCKNVWESDQSRLDALDLRDLIRQLIELAPNVEQLRLFLDAAVKTLSKQAEYAYVANIIVEAVGRLHAPPLEQGEFSENTAALGMLGTLGSPTNSPSPQSLYEQLARELEQLDTWSRTKKLVFYICKNRWESDQQQLNRIPLHELIGELHHQAPTLEHLRWLVSRFVQTLSKQAEYAVVASTLVEKLQRLYLMPDRATSAIPQVQYHAPAPLDSQPSDPTPTPVVPNIPNEQKQRYREIAQVLDAEAHALRIRKLLFYVCRRRWESDSARLNSLNLAAVVQEVHRLVPTAQQLERSLTSIVNSLNKQAEYLEVAEAIGRALGSLYPDSPALVFAQPESDSTSNVAPENVAPENIAPEDEDVEEEEEAPSSPPGPPPQPSQPKGQAAPSFSLLDIRLGIITYANPLRTKILLFSALHEEFGFSHQDWLNLKMHELDGLLRQILYVCKSYTDLEAVLYKTARQFRDSEEMVKTAEVVIRNLRALYVHGNPTLLIEAPADPTRISLDVFDDSTRELTRVEEQENTCQILNANPELTALLEQLPLPLDQLQALAANTLATHNVDKAAPASDVEEGRPPDSPPRNPQENAIEVGEQTTLQPPFDLPSHQGDMETCT